MRKSALRAGTDRRSARYSGVFPVFAIICCVVLLSGCALWDAPRQPNDPLSPASAESSERLENNWGPGEFVALATGTFSSKERNLAVNVPTASWYVRDQHRNGIGLLGGALAYDMVTTRFDRGEPVARRFLSHGMLGIAGHLDDRRIDGSGYSKAHWLFPFYRYRNDNGQRMVYPLFIFPIALRSDDQAVASRGLDSAPWDSGSTYSARNRLDPTPVQALPPDPMITLPPPGSSELRATPPARDLSGRGNAARGSWTATPDPPSAAAGRRYTVRKGDTLYGIARTQYGSGKEWQRIFDANRSLISDPGKIKEGMTLTLPR